MQGGELEEFDKKHVVCGEWLSVPWKEVTNGENVEDVAAELQRELDAEIKKLRSEARRGLIRMMREALARLDEPLDVAAGETVEDREREVFGGSEVTPGIYRDGDRIVAWDYDPAGRDVEGVAISDLDLA
ncbi:hypothetical protein [Microbispora sp. NBRC 16548]|uniref:hypothetical protein n=1 Tax=Microbispora sp. NBRC 16548 TaxID=3030994 RepID=UPI0024A0AE3F|nr:hypothetical protein [Microbispora sp. NBRC 16548]GLX06664.1 hypothetical protein Misp03_35910 [Microbispora sp. NBRC 16548]